MWTDGGHYSSKQLLAYSRCEISWDSSFNELFLYENVPFKVCRIYAQAPLFRDSEMKDAEAAMPSTLLLGLVYAAPSGRFFCKTVCCIPLSN